jgi:Ca-activated chloride channel family protein
VILRRVLSQQVWLLIAWLLVVCSLAKPIWLEDPIEQTQSARDLMIAVDLSGSMAETDFVTADGARIDRLTAVKQVLTEFVAAREHDRLGLIVFGSAPYLQVPFTDDHDAWLQLLDETQVAMAGQSTMMGDAMGLAIKLFETSEVENRMLIVLSDGNDTGSRVPPIEAAKIARQKGITIYNVAIGDPDTEGNEALDLEALEGVSDVTNGATFIASDREGLAKAYAAIDELEPEAFDTLSFRPRHTLHHYPIMALVAITLLHVLTHLAFSLRRRAQPQTRHA